MAIPLLTKSPEINDAKSIAFFKYNSVRRILDPQLGISPIKLVIKGLKILF